MMFLSNVGHDRRRLRYNRISMCNAYHVVSLNAFKQIRWHLYVLCGGPSAFECNLLH